MTRFLGALLAVAPFLLQNPVLAKALFVVPPTQVSIHNPQATEGLRNRTTLSIVVPVDAGTALQAVVLRQIPNVDFWDWGERNPEVYFGRYMLRGKGEKGLASAIVSDSGAELEIFFASPVQPGQTVNVVFRGFNPSSSIYQWATELLPSGDDPVRYVGPTLRLSVYEQDPYR